MGNIIFTDTPSVRREARDWRWGCPDRAAQAMLRCSATLVNTGIAVFTSIDILSEMSSTDPSVPTLNPELKT